MGRLTKSALLGATDLVEKEVELPTIGVSVVVRWLGAAYGNEAQSKALEMKTIGNTQIATVNTAALEELQVLHGLVDPHLDSVEEVRGFMEKCGPAAKAIVAAIDELSGLDKDAIEAANARFPGGAESATSGNGDGLHGPATGSGGPAVPVRAGD